MPRRFGFLLTVSALILLTAGRALAEEVAVDFPPGVQIPDAAVPGPGFEVESATQAYLALLSAEQRARSDAYFEGKYWLGLWELVYSLAILFVLLTLRWSARLRDWAQRMTARRWVQTLLYGLLFTPLVWLLSLPFSAYTGFVREHYYGLSNQNFGA